jgi:hypothetical protein
MLLNFRQFFGSSRYHNVSLFFATAILDYYDTTKRTRP